MGEAWWLYMVECEGGGIYVGIAKDADARYRKHVNGQGALYTKLNPPLALLVKIKCPNRKAATEIERAVKKLPAWEKWRLARALSGTASTHDVAYELSGLAANISDVDKVSNA